MAHLEHNAEAQEAPIRRRMLGCEFTYENINRFQCKGYSFDNLQDPQVFHKKHNDINYWKAQLAFRGTSSAGNDMMGLIQRCINIDSLDVMHPRIRNACIDMSREWDQIWGGDEWEGDEENEWEDDWEEVVEEDELYDEGMEDEEDDEFEDYDEIGEDMDEDEDEDGHGGINFEEIIDAIVGGGGNWNYAYRSWRL